MDEREQAILEAWHANAAPWTRAVREQAIASRRLATDRAILDAVLAHRPRRVIDLGCGEGWLVRGLAEQGVDVLGIDAVPALVEAARAAGGGRFLEMDYADVANGALRERADVVACNFSLFGGESVDALLRTVPSLLTPGGVLVVQTLHPFVACGDDAYADGWRAGSWVGCGEGFGQAAPWYFRTLAGWLDALTQAGLQLRRMVEPLHPPTGKPASVILMAEARR
ncbi:trans-aconitate 2-methyltransferase [Rhodanobacter sp. Si-c]|uniref:Trans-aconitate 2-methyltransferase n=1 Tax=Rhodanobacter lycopersici TaxID=3162487 RepID=A0ABV3Q8Q3_9GAMM